MASVQLDNICKSFGPVRAVDGVSLDIPDGELMVLVGPSGCGKSTLLRLVAGLEAPTSGAIFLDERDVSCLKSDRSPPFQERNHLIWENIPRRAWQGIDHKVQAPSSSYSTDQVCLRTLGGESHKIRWIKDLAQTLLQLMINGLHVGR